MRGRRCSQPYEKLCRAPLCLAAGGRERQAPGGAAGLAPAPWDPSVLVGAGERLGLTAMGKHGEKALAPQEDKNQGVKRRFPPLQVGFNTGE